MAGQAGLGGVPQQSGQAGLSDQPMTMGERYRLSRTMRQQGYTPDDIRTALGMSNEPAPVEEEDRTVGTFGDLAYGARSALGGFVGGAGELAEDQLGWDGFGSALKSLGEYVGPSEAQEQAQADEAAYRQEQVDAGQMSGTEQFAREAGDAIVESTPAMAGVAAGAAAGGAAGSAFFGVGAIPGALIGGLLGGAAVSFPMMYDEQLKTAEANGHDRNDPEVQKKALTGAAINTSMDVIVPLKLLRRVDPGKALEIAQQSVLKKGAKTALKEASIEGGTEVAQLATGAILFDEELQAKMTKEERAQLFPYIAQEYGKDIALNFIAGAGAGGVFAAPAGIREQQLANAKIRQSSEVLSKAAETTGAPLEAIKEKAKTPEGAREIAAAAAEIQMAEIKRENAKSLYNADPTPERKKAFEAVEREADATYDRVLPTFGGRKLTEVKAEREAVQATEKKTAFQKLKEQGLKPKADATYEAVTSSAKRLEKAVADLAEAEERRSVAQSPKSVARTEQQVQEATKAYAKAKSEAARAVGDMTIDEATVLKERAKKEDEVKATQGREKAIERDLAANFPAWMSPEQKKARAQEIIAEAEAKPDAELIAQHRKLTAKVAKALPGSPEQVRLQRQIDQLGTRMGGVSPAVEAARRVLQAGVGGSATGGTTGSSPVAAGTATEAAADVKAGQTKEGAAAVAKAEAAPGKPDILRPRDIKPETLNRFAMARAASAKAPELTPQTEAIARDLLIEGGAEPTQANIDILVKSPGVVAKRLAQITKTSRSKDRGLTAAMKAGFAIEEGGLRSEWQHLIGIVDPADDRAGVEQALRSWTATSGKEASATFDDAGNLLGAGTNNDDNGIMPPSNGWGGIASVMTHTHPEETPFSMADVMVLATSPALKVYRAVTPGQAIELRPTEALRAASEDTIYAAVRPVQDWLYDNLPFDSRIITPLSASRIQQEAQLRLLARQGLIDYSTPMTGFTLTEEDYINGAIEAAAAKPEPRENERGPAAQGQESVPADGQADTGADRLSGGAPSPQARGRDPVYPEFHAAWRAGTRNEDLIQRPEFVLANGKMMTAPLTSRRPGFNTPQWHASRVYTIDGQEVTGTAAALDAFYKQAVELAANELRLPIRPVRADRVLTIVTGPPASGKSTIANEIAYAQGAAILDSDEFKKALPEFGDGSGANAVHTESKVITDAMEELLLAEGANIVYPKVGHEPGSITKLGRKFKDRGYTVNFVNLDVPVDTAMNRMLGRFGMTGRLIPPSYLLEEVGDNPSRTHNEMERIGEFDGYARLDGLTPYGRTPEILSQTGDPLAGTKFASADGSPDERGPASAQPRDAGDTGRQAPKISRGEDVDQDTLEEEGIGETRLARGRSRVDRRALQQLSQSVLSWAQVQPKKRGPQPPFMNLAQAGDLSVESLSKAIDTLMSGIGSSAGAAMMRAGEKLFPPAEGDPQVALAIGLGLANAVARQGFGSFSRRETTIYERDSKGKATPHTVSTFTVDDKLKDFLGLKRFGFMSPMANPDDTSQIKLDGARNLMDGPALERAEATARMLQAQRYTIDQAAVDAIVADPSVLISKKSRGENEVGASSRTALTRRLSRIQTLASEITRADVKGLMPAGTSNYNLDKVVTAIQSAARALTLEDIGFAPGQKELNSDAIRGATAPMVAAMAPLELKGADPKNAAARLKKAVERLPSNNLDAQLAVAKQRAARLKDYAEGAQGREIGFRYGIDKKGRLYPDGEFHHQSGDVIKGIFRTADGRSLADMESFDHTGSGWQIAALIARDDAVADRVNIKAGMASDPNPPKGDIYIGVVDKIVAEVERGIAAGDPDAIFFRDAVMTPTLEETGAASFAKVVRPFFKTPVIAVNYGGSDRQFTEALMTSFSDKLFAGGGKPPSSFWSFFEDVAGRAMSTEAPAVIRFKAWAIDALETAVRTAVGNGVDPSTLVFTVGPDAKYNAVKKLLSKPKDIEARDTTEGAAFPSVKFRLREPVAPKDPLKGIDYPKTAKNIFSQIIQGYDAAVMHDAVARYRRAVPGGFMATNHDSYTIPDENRQALATAVNEALHAMILKGGNVGERLRQEILDQTGLDVGEPPALGSYNLDDVLTSAPVWREGRAGADDTPMSVPAPAVSRARDVPQKEGLREVRGDTYQGVWGRFTLPNPSTSRPAGRTLALTTNAKNADEQSKMLDDLIAANPNPLSSEGAWVEMMNDAFGTPRVQMPPFRTMKIIQQGPAAIVDELKGMPVDMQEATKGGLALAEEFGKAYSEKRISPATTAKLFLWSFLSRGVSPYVQEAAFLDAAMSPEIDAIIEEVVATGWTSDLERRFKDWSKTALRQGTPGRGTQHNLNAFGTNFLKVMSQKHEDAGGRTGLQIIHDMISDGTPSKEIRREFLKRGSGAGIDNKVVSFTLLLMGRTDVLVLDRIQMRNQFDDGRFAGDNIYDTKSREKTPEEYEADVLAAQAAASAAGVPFNINDVSKTKEIAGSGAATLSFGHQGLLYYETMEEALAPIIEKAYRQLMRGKGSLGRYHWDSWLKASNQEVGHSSVEGLVRQSLGDARGFEGIYVRNGKFNEYDYGAKYTVLPGGDRATVLDNLMGTPYIIPRDAMGAGKPLHKAFRKIQDALKKQHPDKYVRSTGSINPEFIVPWTSLMNEEQRNAYAEAVARAGTPAENLEPDRPDAAGSALEPSASRGTDGPDVRQRRAGAGDNGGISRPAGPQEKVAGRPAKTVREFPDGRSVYETDPATFSRQIAAAKAVLGPIGAQVGDGAGDRQFLFDDGASGFALEGDNIISVFSTPGKSAKGAARRVLEAAVAEGGRRLDGFDTFLPDLYAANGFRAVARLPFNREYAPDGWDYAFFDQTFGNETPDVVFMVYDPDGASPDTDTVIDDYDDGGRLQAEALSAPKTSRGIDTREARIGKPPGPEVAFRLSNTAKRPRDRVADIRHNLTSYDRDAVLAAVVDRGRNGPAYAKVVADAEALMTGWINGASLSLSDRAAMLAAAAEHRRQKSLGSFRPMDQQMATELYREMGRLIAEGRMDEGDIARALNKTREQAAKIAATARAAHAKGPSVSRGTDTPEFRRWFKDSKVVDDQGKPLVVYHGTLDTFDTFKSDVPRRQYDEAGAEGFFFTSNTGEAGLYAGANARVDGKPVIVPGGNIVPVYVSLQNPKIVSITDRDTFAQDLVDGNKGQYLRDVKAAGNDGLIIRRRTGDQYDTDFVVAFRPEQVKSVFNQGTFDPIEPAISRGIDSLFRRPAMAPATQPALPGITSSRQGAPTPYATSMAAAKDGSLLRRMGRAIERQVFNQQAGLKQIERALGDDGMSLGEGMSRMAQMMTASSGRVAAMMQYGAPKWDAKEKVFTYAPGTKGLTEIFKFDNVDDYDRFQGWAFAKRDRGLMSRGKGARMTPALLAQYENIPEADKKRYDAMLADYRTFNEAMLDLMRDSGLISQESRDALSEDQEYVPMFRAFEDASDFGMQDFFGKAAGFSHPDPGIRKLKENPAKVGEPNGGNFADLIEGIQSGAIAALHAAQQNIANAQIHDFMSGNLGHEVQDIKAATGMSIKTLGRNAKKKAFNALEQDAIKFYRDGKEVYYKAVGENTEFTAAFQLALAGLRPRQLDGLDKALKAFNSFQRTVITSTPSFALASVLRDVGQNYVQSGTRINETLKNNAAQFRQAFAGADQATKDLMMAAGVGGYQMQGMPENTAESFRRKIGAQSNTLWSNAGKWLSEYERVIGSTELGARSAVAESTKRKGGTKGDAAYEALNMIDYNRHGASPLVQRMLYTVLFLNPRLQGLYRLFENTKGNDPRKIAAVSASVFARGLVLGGVAMAARMLSTLDEEDEEAYRNLSVSDRAQYFHIPLPGTARFLKLPKPFEIGAIFGTMPVQIFDSMYSSQNGVNDLGRMVGHTFVNTFSLNPIPQAVMPLTEVLFNYNMFNGMPIEGMRLEGLPKELRIDLSTGGLAQLVGNRVLSPVQIQHILDGYLGPLGSSIYAAVEGTVAGAGLIAPKATSSDGAFGSLPAPIRGTANFTVGRFISKTDAERSTQFVTQFYDVANEIKQYTAAINAAVGMGDMVEARRLAEKSQAALRLKPVFNKVNRRLTELNKALRIAQFAPDMDPAERQRRIDILNVERNRITRAAVEAARKAGVRGSFLGGLVGLTT